MTPFDFGIVSYFLVASSILGLVRVVIGPTTADRLVGINLVAAQVLALIVIAAVDQKNWAYLDVALVYDIFGFIGILAVARFFGKREEKQ
ncbi:MAG: pH regulation protein F [Spirochaetales bacterium]|nr:pH regulation protein F [Spirochaetales bacterium]